MMEASDPHIQENRVSASCIVVGSAVSTKKTDVGSFPSFNMDTTRKCFAGEDKGCRALRSMSQDPVRNSANLRSLDGLEDLRGTA